MWAPGGQEYGRMPAPKSCAVSLPEKVRQADAIGGCNPLTPECLSARLQRISRIDLARIKRLPIHSSVPVGLAIQAPTLPKDCSSPRPVVPSAGPQPGSWVSSPCWLKRIKSFANEYAVVNKGTDTCKLAKPVLMVTWKRPWHRPPCICDARELYRGHLPFS